MLLKIFAAIGAGGSVLHTLIAGQTGNALETTGILLLRFLEYFFGAHIAYVLVMLLSTELFIRKSKPRKSRRNSGCGICTPWRICCASMRARMSR